MLRAKIELSLKKRHRFSGVFFHSDIAEYLKNVIPILRLIGISYPKMGQDLDLKCFQLRWFRDPAQVGAGNHEPAGACSDQ